MSLNDQPPNLENPAVEVAQPQLVNEQIKKDEPKITSSLVLTTFFATLGTSFLFGYNIGVLNNLESFIRRFFLDSWEQVDWDSSSNMFAVTTGIWTGAGMAGAFSTGVVLKLGRQKAIVANCLVMIVGAVLEGVAMLAAEPAVLIIGRAVVGFSCGLNVGIVNIYLPEISSMNIRGAISACHQLMTTAGICVAQLLTLSDALGTNDRWPTALGISGAPAFITMCALPFFPDSPRYLLLVKRDKPAAEKALIKLRGTNDVGDEILEMEVEEEETKRLEKFTLGQLFTSKSFRYSLIIIIVLQVAQQFSGINFIFFYSSEMFKSAGLGANTQYAVLSTGIINFIATLAALPLLEKVGRRPLLIYPLVVMGIACAALVITLQYESLRYLNIVMVCVYIVGFAVGLGPIPPFVASEVFTQEPRPAAMTVATFMNWTCTLIIALLTPMIRDAIGPYVFLIFVCVIAATVVFVVVFLPETKNRTFEDIFQHLALLGRRNSAVIGKVEYTSKDKVAILKEKRKSLEDTQLPQAAQEAKPTEGEAVAPEDTDQRGAEIKDDAIVPGVVEAVL